MAKGKNLVILIGNLGGDVAVKHVGVDSIAVATLSVATNERVKKNGEWVDVAEWHRVNVWGTMATNCEKYLRKGSQVYVEGKLRTRSWDKDGETHYSTEIVAEDVIFLDGKQ